MKDYANDPRYTAYALGELPPAERAAIERELEAAPGLRRHIGQLRAFAEELQNSLHAEPPLKLDEARRATLRAAVASAPAAGRLQRLPVRTVTFIATAAAAVLVFMAGHEHHAQKIRRRATNLSALEQGTPWPEAARREEVRFEPAPQIPEAIVRDDIEFPPLPIDPDTPHLLELAAGPPVPTALQPVPGKIASASPLLTHTPVSSRKPAPPPPVETRGRHKLLDLHLLATPAPWKPGHVLFRIDLAGRGEATMLVVFTPGRVAAYRLTGLGDHPSPGGDFNPDNPGGRRP